MGGTPDFLELKLPNYVSGRWIKIGWMGRLNLWSVRFRPISETGLLISELNLLGILVWDFSSQHVMKPDVVGSALLSG